MPLPAVDYDQLSIVREDALATDVAALLDAHGFGPGDTVLHIHNHALGKNVSWPGAIERLAQRGYRLLLQIHDFVEDFRPVNYRHLARAWNTDYPHQLAHKQYPQGPGIHYAVLTRRDQQLLTLTGVPKARLHTLPNPVGEFVGLKPQGEVASRVRSELGLPAEAKLVLYPVRGIRRKNLGEFLLHAALSPADTWHAITLAPQNPLEMPSFERWQALADELELRALFDTCGGGPSQFLDALAAADLLITTSVAEGFGMVYLEAWMAGKPLIGRDLPAITHEFKSAGLQLDALYQTLDVPLELLEHRDSLAEALQLAYEWASDSYGVRLEDRDAIASKVARLLADGRIDFALLPSRFQEQLIRAAAKDPEATRSALFAANPGLESKLASGEQDASVVQHNAAVVRKKYSLKTVSKQLAKTYQRVVRDDPPRDIHPPENGGAILEQFLRLDRLHAIRFEE
jgi:glycosyltransferase involved in cell wall biosynthesis